MKIIDGKLLSISREDVIDGILEIPNSVTHIGDWAFDGNQLTQVEIPNSVTHIGSGAFVRNQLTQVEIPNSVTHIGSGAFRGNQLTQVEIPNSVTHIGSGAFDGNQLTQVEIPNSVTHIGDWAFDGNQLTQVEIPNSVTHIGSGAFRGNQLTQVEIPNSVTHIGSGAFDGNQLTQVEIPNSVTHIGSGAFDGNQLTQVEIKGKTFAARVVDGSLFIVNNSRSTKGVKVFDGFIFYGYDSVQRVKKTDCFVAEKDGFFAHGATVRRAISDLNFKIVSEKLKKEPIYPDTEITVLHYRTVTGACDLGCREFMSQVGIPFKVVDGNTVEMKPIKAKDLITLLKKKSAYGAEVFMELVQGD